MSSTTELNASSQNDPASSDQSQSPKSALVIYKSPGAPSSRVGPDGAVFDLRFRQLLLGISGTQLFLSVLVLVLGITSLGISLQTEIVVGHIGSAIWGGSFFIITASIGLASSLKEHKCLSTAHMVMSIIAASTVALFVTCFALGWALEARTAAKTISGIRSRHTMHSQSADGRLATAEYRYMTVSNLHATIFVLGFFCWSLAICATALLAVSLCSCCKGGVTARRYWRLVDQSPMEPSSQNSQRSGAGSGLPERPEPMGPDYVDPPLLCGAPGCAGDTLDEIDEQQQEVVPATEQDPLDPLSNA